MGIKLKDYIEDPANVFTEEEAIMLFRAAGYVDLEEIYQGYLEVPLTIEETEQDIYKLSKPIPTKRLKNYSKISYESQAEQSYGFKGFSSKMVLDISNVFLEGVAS